MKDELAERLFRKITWHVIPFIFFGYLIAFVDRINVGFVQLQMGKQLSIDPASFGFAAGIFFLTYAFFELPSNALFVRLGARKTFFRILFFWGLTVIATGFIRTRTELYIMRALLGFFEAGFLPGAVLYLTFWFPSERRARSTAMFLSSVFVASMIVGPLSTAMMAILDGVWGLQGWQWVFIGQGLPAVVLSAVIAFRMVDGPNQANWLTDQEKKLLQQILQADRGQGSLHKTQLSSLWPLLSDPHVYVFVLVYFSAGCTNYFLNFWLPTIIQSLAPDSLIRVGVLSAIPSAVGLVGLVLINWNSDRSRDRRWHLAGCFALTAIGMISSILFKSSLTGTLVCFSVANFALFAVGSLFWTMPATYFNPKQVALGLSIVAGLTNTAGFFSPYVVGHLRTAFGDFDYPVIALASILAVAVLLILLAVPERATRVGMGTSGISNSLNETLESVEGLK